MKLTRPLIVLDLETTGTWVEKDRIIEIGMIRVGIDGGTNRYVRRVNPGIAIPPAVVQLTGIRDEDVRQAPLFKDLAAEVLDFSEEADFAGFNIERFDLPILERECFDAGLRLDWRHRTIYDCQKIYHIHERRDLKAAYRFYCGKDLTNAHSALGDTEATLEILQSQIERYGAGNPYVESLIDFEYEPSSDFFDDERKFRWWNGQLYPVFGKYGRKHSIPEIAQKDPSYLAWLAETDFDLKVKTMLKAAIAGQPPVQAPAVPRAARP